MDVGLVIGLVLFLAFLVLGGIVTVRAVRSVKRGVERTGAQVRRSVEEKTLKARGMQPGPVGEVARVRLELRSSIDNTRKALETGAQDDPALREAVSLLDRLHEHARHLDGELRSLMDGEPDRARVTARLPEARERMRRLKESADSLRFAAQDRARQFDRDGLDSLREQIQIESGALRHWTSEPLGSDPFASGPLASDPLASGTPAPDPLAAEERRSELGRSRETRQERPEQERKDALAEPSRPVHGMEKRRPRSAS